VALVNIGGVANMTWIGRDGELVAFDTGPGNALLNDWCHRFTGETFDRDGALAARGRVDGIVLARLMASAYFGKPPPKSLDRNGFDVSVLEGLSPEDGAATLTRFTAEAIALSGRLVPQSPELLVICGGGRLNPTLMRDLESLLEPAARVVAAEAVGFNGDAMEAEAWAYLAVRCLHGLPITFPGTTGAPEPISGGRLAKP
jgi:anhydro-N-acetylmuramic acid kinase